MCFAHSGAAGDGLHVQAVVGADAATAFSSTAGADGLGSIAVTGSGTPDKVVAPRGERVLDGFSHVMHNRWNRDLESTVTVRPGEEIQLLCRDALDIGDQARTLTDDGVVTLDLGRIHPLTGSVHVDGAEPGDILEVERLDVRPIVDFGYVTVSPVLGLFGALRPEVLAPFAAWTEPSQLSDPSPGTVAGAIPADQPHNDGAGLRRGREVLRGRRPHGTGGRGGQRDGAQDADVLHSAVRRRQEHRHHRVPRHRPGGRPDPARPVRRHARRGVLHHDRAGPDPVDLPNWLVSMTVPRGIFV